MRSLPTSLRRSMRTQPSIAGGRSSCESTARKSSLARLAGRASSTAERRPAAPPSHRDVLNISNSPRRRDFAFSSSTQA